MRGAGNRLFYVEHLLETVEATIWFLQQRLQRNKRLNPHLNGLILINPSPHPLILGASIQQSHPSKGSLSYPHHTVDSTSMLSLLSFAPPLLILTRDRKAAMGSYLPSPLRSIYPTGLITDHTASPLHLNFFLPHDCVHCFPQRHTRLESRHFPHVAHGVTAQGWACAAIQRAFTVQSDACVFTVVRSWVCTLAWLCVTGFSTVICRYSNHRTYSTYPFPSIKALLHFPGRRDA